MKSDLLITETCPHCGHTFTPMKRDVATPIECPKCRGTITVAERDEEAGDHVREASEEHVPPSPEENSESASNDSSHD